MGNPIWIGEKKQKAIEIILNEISDGKSCRSILSKKRDHNLLPSHVVFIEWLEDDEKLAKQYARACQDRAEKMADEILQIADDSSNDTIIITKGFGENKEEIEIENKEWVNRSRLRVDTRKWLLSKLYPKKYGDKINTEISGELKVNKEISISYEDINDSEKDDE